MFAGLTSILNAIRSIAAIVSAVKSIFDAIRESSIERKYKRQAKKREEVIRQIEGETDDEKLRQLHRKLRNLS